MLHNLKQIDSRHKAESVFDIPLVSATNLLQLCQQTLPRERKRERKTKHECNANTVANFLTISDQVCQSGNIADSLFIGYVPEEDVV